MTRPIHSRAGKHLFDQGYYVQSVLFPAVPYHAGVLRVQCNANHEDRAIDGLIDAFASLTEAMGLPAPAEKSTSGRGTNWNGLTEHGGRNKDSL